MKSLRKENHGQMYFFNIEKPSTVTFFRNVHCTLMHVSHIQWNYFFRNLISFCFHLPKRPESDIISTSLSLIVCWSLTQCHSFRNRSPKWLGDRFIFLFHLMLCESKCLKFIPDIGLTTKIALYVFWYLVDSW